MAAIDGVMVQDESSTLIESGAIRVAADDVPSFDGLTVVQARRALTTRLASAGREPAALDARLLAEEATGLSHADFLRDGDQPVSRDAARALSDLAVRRMAGEPTSRLIGRRQFDNLEIIVRPDVLDPRDDSETIVRLAVDLRPDPRDVSRILDLGTGSGALLCALLRRYPSAFGFGIDRSESACLAARANLQRNRLENRGLILRGDWTKPLAGPFDLIVSNPPYIATGDLADLADEVRLHDPRLALDGGHDGLDAYRAILADVRRIAAPGALLVLEIGAGMREDVQRLLTSSGCRVIRAGQDGAGLDRALASEFV